MQFLLMGAITPLELLLTILAENARRNRRSGHAKICCDGQVVLGRSRVKGEKQL